MKLVNQDITILSGGTGQWNIGGTPPLTVLFNPGVRPLLAEINSWVYFAIYELSCGNTAKISGYIGGNIFIAPCYIHVTAGAQR
jgi:hypothetical protein